jgi:hypothetical protein
MGERITKSRFTIARKGILLAYVIGGTCCAHSRAVIRAQGPSVQVQCGFRLGENLSRDQASCIAVLVGMDQGLCPWSITQGGDNDERHWTLSNATAHLGTCGCGTKGQTMDLNLRTGRLMRINWWLSDCLQMDGVAEDVSGVHLPSSTETQSSSAQSRCGVRRNQTLTADQAICIATLIDFDRGVCPWKVTMANHDEQEWSITNTAAFQGDCTCGTGGETLYINQHTGRLSTIGWWSGGCVG